jgi:serine/threonine protein kinase/dienelactone hydrolase
MSEMPMDNSEDSTFCRKCGTPLPFSKDVQFSRTMTLDSVQKIMSKGSFFAGRYRILGELGQGGMGIVYKAEDTKLKRTVALKFLPTELNRYPEAQERFVREAQAAAVLDHPNICTVHEVEEAEGVTYIAMAYIEGQSLREKIAKRPLDIDLAADIALQVAEGLEAAHRKGIIHRDIKSGNIMVKEDGQARIMDFGLAKIAGESVLTREAVTIGTVAYMSPEQARGEVTDHRTDIWSLGIVLYEMLTGELPFRGERETSVMYAIVHEEPRPLQKLKPGIPIEISKIVEKALKKDRNARYASAAEMAQDLRKYQESVREEAAGIFNLRSLLRRLRKPQIAIPAALALIAVAFLIFSFFNRQAKIRWANNVALPEIERLLKTSDTKAPFELALQAEKYIPKSQKLAQLRPLIAGSITVETEPSGAEIRIKDYVNKEDNWENLGYSPISNIRTYQGYKHWRIEKAGFEPIEGTSYVRPSFPTELKIKLDLKGSIPPGMVRVRGGSYSLSIPGLRHRKSIQIEDFFLDKFEVTNRQFKEFVDEGGYKKREYWKHRFVKEGRDLIWEDAMKEFRDKTGRLGPATWEFGDYPQGRENYPVSGVSWYEAAAYAEFSGKSLPTVFHWNGAAGNYYVDSGFIIASSNLGGQSVAAVGGFYSLGPYGTYDMAGNVKEWCWNEIDGKRFILGGAWNEAQTMFGNCDYYPPFTRSENFGFRCLKYIAEKNEPGEALASIEVIPPPDFNKNKPCSDEVYEIYKRLYAYTKTDLAAKIESIQEWSEYTTIEKVSFNDAYGQERVFSYFFIPCKAEPPFQTVIYVPGASAWDDLDSVFDYGTVKNREVELFTKSGRAFVFPVFKGTFERRMKPIPKSTPQYLRDYYIQLYRDLARTIDYLETRPEFDKEKLAYQGLSSGAVWGPLFASLERRLKAAIFLSGGIWAYGEPWSTSYSPENYMPERDMINFAPRVKIPVLMQNGKYDYMFPWETTIVALYNLLGTPEKDKKLISYETGHSVWLHNEYRKDMFDFLDQYLGPAK